MISRILVIVFILSLLISSCAKDAKQDGYDVISKTVSSQQIQAQTQSLRGEDIYTNPPIASIRSMAFHNGLLYLSELTDADSLVTIVNPDNAEIIGYLIKKGEGPNELSFADEFSVHGGRFHVFDPYRYDVYSVPARPGESIMWPSDDLQRVSVKEIFTDNVVAVGDRVFVNYYAAEETARFAEVSRTGKVLGFIGDLPPHPDSSTIDKRIYNMMYTVNPAVPPANDKFALAYEYQDLIEIYNKDAELLHRVAGPDFFYPEFVLKQSGSGYKATPIRGKTRKGYGKINATNDEIWALYSGEILYPLEGDAEGSYGNDLIIVFDWAGNFLRAYRLNVPIYHFCIDANGKVIYAITEENDTHIVKFRY